jgi:hypothetical protein
MTDAAPAPGVRQAARATPTYSYAEGVPPGWRTFAGAMIAITATFNVIDGLVALFNSSYYASVAAGHNIHLPITDSVTAWGWVALITGLVLYIVAFGVFANAVWARAIGVVVVAFNMVFHMGFLASFPLWSLLIIGLDVLIVYGLVVPTPETSTSS